MKKVLFCLTLIIALFTLSGCSTDKKNNSTTVAGVLVNEFETIAEKENSVTDIAKKLSENKVLKISVMSEKLTEDDYVDGFNKEINNYKEGAYIRPVIGTIPFVAYVFEVDNPEDFSKELEDNANLSWNICTTADEVKVSIVNNYVFFIMSPKSFE